MENTERSNYANSFDKLRNKEFADYLTDQLGKVKKAVKQAISRDSESVLVDIRDAAKTYGTDETLTTEVIRLFMQRYDALQGSSEKTA